MESVVRGKTGFTAWTCLRELLRGLRWGGEVLHLLQDVLQVLNQVGSMVISAAAPDGAACDVCAGAGPENRPESVFVRKKAIPGGPGPYSDG